MKFFQQNNLVIMASLRVSCENCDFFFNTSLKKRQTLTCPQQEETPPPTPSLLSREITVPHGFNCFIHVQIASFSECETESDCGTLDINWLFDVLLHLNFCHHFLQTLNPINPPGNKVFISANTQRTHALVPTGFL